MAVRISKSPRNELRDEATKVRHPLLGDAARL